MLIDGLNQKGIKYTNKVNNIIIMEVEVVGEEVMVVDFINMDITIQVIVLRQVVVVGIIII